MFRLLQSFRFLLQSMVNQQKWGLNLSGLNVLPPLLSKCHNILKFMPQVLESASVRTSLFSFKKVLLPSQLKKESLQTWSKGTQNAWKQKDCERELQVHFLKQLIISKPNAVLEAWLMVFQAPEAKLQMWPVFPRSSSCPPPSVLFREGKEGKKANRNNSSRHSVTLCSTSV